MNNFLKWHEISLECAAAEELGAELLEIGASGTQIISDRELLVWYPADESIEASVEELLIHSKSNIKDRKITEGTGWLAGCQMLFESCQVGKFSVNPVVADSAELVPHPDQIYIIPGTGFGTGHHETTQICGEYLSFPEVLNSKPSRILDFGTGSGILAIIAALTHHVPVSGIDNDPLALINARDNIDINIKGHPSLADLLTLKCGSVDQIEGKYDLVIANIYADLLIELGASLVNAVTAGGWLVVSGIEMARKWEVYSKLKECGVTLVAEKEKGDSERAWAGAIFKN